MLPGVLRLEGRLEGAGGRVRETRRHLEIVDARAGVDRFLWRFLPEFLHRRMSTAVSGVLPRVTVARRARPHRVGRRARVQHLLADGGGAVTRVVLAGARRPRHRFSRTSAAEALSQRHLVSEARRARVNIARAAAGRTRTKVATSADVAVMLLADKVELHEKLGHVFLACAAPCGNRPRVVIHASVALVVVWKVRRARALLHDLLERATAAAGAAHAAAVHLHVRLLERSCP